MDTGTIIKASKAKYHHLDETTVTMIIAKVEKLRKGNRRRTEGMKEIARENGCSLNTVYRIYRLSEVDIQRFDYRKAEYVHDHFEHDHYAAKNIRRERRDASKNNGSKFAKCAAFIRSCLFYIRESKIHTIDESVSFLKAGYTGNTVCTKTFYNWVNAGKIKGFGRKDLPRAPGWKSRKKSYKTYTPEDSRGKSILVRPENINSREEFGHWEGDLVVGPKDGINGAYLTLIERQTRFFLMIPVADKKSATVFNALKEYRDSHPCFGKVFKSITFDNGSEFSKWKEMEFELGIETWFGRPYHSCDRGSNENCNGLIRRYIKKGTDINTVSMEETLRINLAINRKRRKLLGYETAERCFTNALVKHGIPFEWMYP